MPGSGQPKTAFVFAGGGSFGAIQVGMLHSLASHGIVADMVFGSSVGAVNAAYYAGTPTLEGIRKLETIWRGLRRQDVFPLTALAGSWITISTAWLAHSMRLNDIGELFMIAMWLIASSTVAGMLLMRWLRQWRAASAVEGAAS